MGVRIEERGSAVVLTVDRPESRNAVDRAVHDALAAGLDDAESGGARAVVLTGAGGAFLSGGDLRVIRDEPFEATLTLCERMRALLDRFERSPLPVLAAIDGHAFGGGCEVAVACDYRVASSRARLSFRQAAMGVSTGWGAGARLPRLVPRGVAVRLLLTSEVIDAASAHRLGLVEELADDPLARCLAMAESIAARPRSAVAGLKRVIQASYAGAVEATDVESAVFAELWGGPDQRAALRAYFERRSEG